MTGDKVWLHKVESWDRDTDRPDGTIHTSDQAVDQDLDYEVPATSHEVVRWQAAERAYLAAQAEMRALYQAAEDVQNAAYDTVEAAEEFLAEEQDAIDQAAATVAEAEAELQHGPREWVVVIRGREREKRGRYRVEEIGRTLHRLGCPVLARVEQAIRRMEDEHGFGSSYTKVSDPVRRPEAINLLRGRWPGTIPQPCKRCASDLVGEEEVS